MTQTALGQIQHFLPELEAGTVMRVKQDPTRASYWRKRGFQDGQIDFRMDSRRIYDLVRALSRPFVGAHVMYHSEPVKVWAARVATAVPPSNIEPGKILDVRNRIITVKTFGGAIDLVEHEFPALPTIGDYL